MKVSKEIIRQSEIVPAKVVQHNDEFWQCPQCKNIYWEGPKFFDALRKFKGMFEDFEEIENKNPRS